MKGKIITIRFVEFLAIVSIAGFFGIFMTSLAGVDLSAWIEGFFFIVLGIALIISGGIQFIFKYMQGGLTNDEITKIMTIIVGVASLVVGIFTFPIGLFSRIQSIPLVDGVKALVSLLAIIVIAVDTWIGKKRC